MKSQILTPDTPLPSFATLTDRELRQQGLLIAESPNVIARALDAGLAPVGALCEEQQLEKSAVLFRNCPDLPVFVADHHTLSTLTGYSLTRGLMCVFRRPSCNDAGEILREARRVCVLYDICDTTNIGAIFRTAAALGYDAIILSPTSCDPFNRRAVRVSMGTVFQIPWCVMPHVMETLHSHGFHTAAAALSRESVFLQDFKVSEDEKYAVILGSEGWGLPSDIIASADHVVKIPMHQAVDSLNVAAAAAIFLWHFHP